jgi:phosphatidate cytidylyltransferase
LTEPGQEQSGRAPRNWSDLGPRLLSAAVLIAVTVASLAIGGLVFAFVVGLVFAGVYREWETMVTREPLGTLSWVQIGLILATGLVYPIFGPLGSVLVIVGACAIAWLGPAEHRLWRCGGLGFYGLVVIAVLAMRGETTIGIWAGVYLGVTVWCTDSAAFFTGRQLGGEKLAPDISPSKTWSGALGGLALGATAGTLVWWFVADAPLWIGAILSLLVSFLAQLGDLSESAIKRHFRVKDSGDIIPGHGGLMDRLDSLTFSALLVLVLGTSRAGIEAVAPGLMVW